MAKGTFSRRALLIGVWVLMGWAYASPGWAGRPVRVYEVDIRTADAKSAQSTAALQDAMREALVRATGRRESASDPAFAPLIAQAADYVKSYGTGSRGETRVIFDGAALERAIAAAGRSVW